MVLIMVNNQIMIEEIYTETNTDKDIVEVYSKKIGFLGFYIKETNIGRFVFKPNPELYYKVHYLIKIIDVMNKLNNYEKSEVKI